MNFKVIVLEELPCDYPELNATFNQHSLDQIFRLTVNEKKLTYQQLSDFRHVLEKFQEFFIHKTGQSSLLRHNIELTSKFPIRSKACTLSPLQKAIFKQEAKKMLDLGVIEPGESEYASHVILVEAPGKDPRPFIDYRKLNAVTGAQL